MSDQKSAMQLIKDIWEVVRLSSNSMVDEPIIEESAALILINNLISNFESESKEE